jgi:PHD/YefM family antitoxin component YafN of YafNO toxin-antitoxin module
MFEDAMINLSNIHPVTDFTRKTKEYIQRLKETGDPEVLTVNGQAEIVVQSANAYQKLLDRAERAEILPMLQKSLAEAKRGEGRPARDVLKEIAATVGVKLD